MNITTTEEIFDQFVAVDMVDIICITKGLYSSSNISIIMVIKWKTK